MGLLELGVYNSSDPISMIQEYQVLSQWFKFLRSKHNPNHNKYYLLYTKIPHPPFVLKEDCTYSIPINHTNMEDQNACSIIILERFINTLRKKHTDNNFYFVFHSDHGVAPHRKNPILISNIFLV